MKDLLDGDPIIVDVKAKEPPPHNRNLNKALRLAGFGFRVFPCREKTTVDPETGEEKKIKTPYTFHGFKDGTTDAATVRKWWTLVYPGALVGLCTGGDDGVDVVDLDVKDGKNGFDAVEAIFGELPATFAYRTLSGGEHRLYRRNGSVIKNATDAFKDRYDGNATGIDIRGDGGYVIFYGDVPPDLPARLADWPAKLDKALKRDEETAREAPPEKEAAEEQRPDWTPEERAEELKRVQDALEYVPADDRERWLKIGMALKAAFGADGRPVWDEWSQTSEKFDAKDQNHKWGSFKKSGIGLGTLYQIAKDYGWEPKDTGLKFCVGKGADLFADRRTEWAEMDAAAKEEEKQTKAQAHDEPEYPEFDDMPWEWEGKGKNKERARNEYNLRLALQYLGVSVGFSEFNYKEEIKGLLHHGPWLTMRPSMPCGRLARVWPEVSEGGLRGAAAFGDCTREQDASRAQISGFARLGRRGGG